MSINIPEGLYNAVMSVASIAAAPAFLCSDRGRRRLAERYGSWDLPAKHFTWFHGASVGEVNGLLPVIQKFRELGQQSQVLLTSSSPTGLDRGAESVDLTRLQPFDSRAWIQRGIGEAKIDKFIFGETEIWPELIHTLSDLGVESYLVNARLSEGSFNKYKIIEPVFKRSLKRLSLILCSDADSAERFEALGADSGVVQVVGNAKYDRSPSVENHREIREGYFDGNAPVLVLGSIRPGEEAGWFEGIKNVRQDGHSLNVIVAPRHHEKFGYFETALESHGISFKKKTGLTTACDDGSTILLDTYGELEATYSFADIAFIGGSLVDEGGHNPLEAAAYATPVAMGPYRRNVEGITQELEAKDAIFSIVQPQSIKELVERIFSDRESLRQAGERSRQVWQRHLGASRKIVDAIWKEAG